MNRWTHGVLVALIAVWVGLGADWAGADERERERPEAKLAQQLEVLEKAFDNNQGAVIQQILPGLKKEHPEHPDVLAFEGQFLIAQNNAAGATAALTKAIEKQPNHPRASALLAFIELRTAKGEEASKRIDAALAAHPDDRIVLQMAMQVYMGTQAIDKAEPVLKKLTEHPQANAQLKLQAQAQLGQVLAQRGKHAEAADVFEKVMNKQWHPDVAFARIEQLQLAGDHHRCIASISAMRTALPYHQNRPVREAFEQRVAPIERAMKVARVESVIDGTNEQMIGYQFSYLDALTIEFERAPAVDEQAKAMLPKLHKAGLEVRERALRELLAKPVAEAGNDMLLLQRIDRELDAWFAKHKTEPSEAHTALRARLDDRIFELNRNVAGPLLELAESGWRIQDFDRPTPEQVKILEEKGGKRWRELPMNQRNVLTTYFKRLDEQRFEQIKDYERPIFFAILNPTDTKRGDAAVEAFAAHLMKIDAMKEQPTEELAREIFPPRIFAFPPRQSGIQLGNTQANNRNLAHSMWDHFGFTGLVQNARDFDTAIEKLTEIINLYPLPGALIRRSDAYLLKGDFKQAYRDLVLALAVEHYEEANTYPGRTRFDPKNWKYARIPAVQQLHRIIEGQRTTEGPLATASFLDAQSAIRQKRWVDLARYIAQEHDANSFDVLYKKHIGNQFFSAKLYGQQMLDAIAAAHAGARDETSRADFLKLAQAVGADLLHPYFALQAARAADTDEDREKLMLGSLPGGYNHPELNLELGRFYEKKGERELAMMHYCLASGGKNPADLQGHARTAAEARNRLEGTTDRNAIHKIYAPLADEFFKKGNERSVLDCYRWIGLLDRFATNGSPLDALHGTYADAYRGAGEHEKAIAALMNFLGTEDPRRPLARALIGREYESLGRFREALDYYHRARQDGFRETWIYSRAGALHRNMLQFDEAIEMFTECLKIDPENTYALAPRSEIYQYIKGDLKNALADAEKLREIHTKKNPDYKSIALDLRISQMKIDLMFAN